MINLQEMQSYCWHKRWNPTSYSEGWTFLLPRNRYQTQEDLQHTLTPLYADSAPIYSTLDWWNIWKLQTCCCDYKSITSPEEILNLQPCSIFLTSMTQKLPIPYQHCHMCTPRTLSISNNSDIQRYESHVHMYTPPHQATYILLLI
jgi:hypothetical protein